MRIVFLATSDFAVPTLEALAQGPEELVAVFTRPDRPAGRGLKLRPSPVKIAAERLGLPLYQPARVSREEGLETLRGLAPDLLLVAAFGEILKPEVLALPRLAPVNLHASLLPKYRGAAPIHRALLAGEEETGVTAQWMAEGLDTGDILLARSLSVDAEENFGSLHGRLAALAAAVAGETLALFRRGEVPRLPQVEAEASYAPPVTREDLLLDWRRPAEELHRQVRAFSPRPGARTTHQGRLLKVLAARLASQSEQKGVPGEIVEISTQGLRVHTGSASLIVLQVQPEGRTPMSAVDYALGRRTHVGEMLGKADC